MRTSLRLALAAALAALPAHAQMSPAPAAGPEPERGTFVLSRGGQQVGVERFTRTPGRLEGEVVLAAGQRTVYTAELNPDATVRSITVRFFAPRVTTGGAAGRAVVVTFLGDSARVEQAGGGAPRTLATQAGALPAMRSSVALVEQLLRRGRALGGGRVGVPTFLLEGGRTVVDTVEFAGADSVFLHSGRGRVTLLTDAEGRVLGGDGVWDGLSVARRPGHAPDPAAAPERGLVRPPSRRSPRGAVLPTPPAPAGTPVDARRQRGA